jgi:hypothetical protein
MRNPHHYLVPQQRIPGYLPYPNPVAPGPIPVANASSVNWPQAQFAEPFVPAGTPSFSPYRYPDYAQAIHLGDPMYDGEAALPNPDVMGFIEANKKIILGVALAAVLVKSGALDKILARF